ncbi:MAG TPA: cupredoxin family copper-binding protein [Candidatus Binatia bacterium]|nr:cupredoxin family copper-binding protein [Candidatus Binatia bacterium]
MKQYGASLAILTAILVGSSPVLAHEECDDVDQSKVASWQDQSVGLRSQSGSNITIKLFQYQPGRMQVKAGTTVTWVNEDEIFHTVTAEKKEGSFDAPLDGKGKSFSFTFSQPGTYAYYCDRHEHMRGEIEVR